MLIQLDMFQDEDEMQMALMKQDIEKIRSSSEKVRRGMFARHGELARMYVDMNTRLEIIERNICHGK